jgi:hypothetical protein
MYGKHGTETASTVVIGDGKCRHTSLSLTLYWSSLYPYVVTTYRLCRPAKVRIGHNVQIYT